MAAEKTTTKPTTKTATAAAPEVAKVPAGTADKGANAPAPDTANSGAAGMTQVDQAVADAVADLEAKLANARAEERQNVLNALMGEGALPPDVREALDKQLASARKEGFDAGKEEALEELSEMEPDNEAGPGADPEAVPTPPDDDRQSIYARSILLGIVLRLPEVYRVAGEGPKLNELAEFVDTFEESDDRYMAVELMKVLAETKAAALASTNYQSTIRNGIKLIRGEAVQPVLTDSDSQDAAANRLDQAMKGRPNDIPPEALPPREPNLGAEHQVVTAEQQKAADRLSRATNNR